MGESSNKDPEEPLELVGMSVSTALKVGYRHFDSAEIYKSSSYLKEALSNSSIDRNQIFITSKIAGLPVGDYSVIKERVKKQLDITGLSYFDLLLIHWPGEQDFNFTGDPTESIKKASFSYFKENIHSSWLNMQMLKKDGIVRNVGVSNFYKQHIDELLSHISNESDKPYANQIYIDLMHQEKEFTEYLQGLGIKVIAYRPITFLPVTSFIEEVSESIQSIISSLNNSDNISPQKLTLAWLMKRNIHVIPKSTNPVRIQENFDSINLMNELTSSIMEKCASLDGNEMVDMYGGCDEYAIAFKSIVC